MRGAVYRGTTVPLKLKNITLDIIRQLLRRVSFSTNGQNGLSYII